MSITFDQITQSNVSGNDPGTEPFTVTVGAGNKRILLASVMASSSTGGASFTQYNGVTMTELFNVTVDVALNLWVGYIVAPPMGPHALNVAWGTVPTSFRVGTMSFFGVDQVSPIGGSNHIERTNNSSATISTTVTVQGAEGMIVDFLYGRRTSAGNAKAPQIETMNNTGQWAGGIDQLGGISYVDHSGSDVTMEWENLTSLAAADQAYYAVELLPFTGEDLVPQPIIM